MRTSFYDVTAPTEGQCSTATDSPHLSPHLGSVGAAFSAIKSLHLPWSGLSYHQDFTVVSVVPKAERLFGWVAQRPHPCDLETLQQRLPFRQWQRAQGRPRSVPMGGQVATKAFEYAAEK